MEVLTVIEVWLATASSQNDNSEQKTLDQIREATGLGQIILVRVFGFP